MHIHDWLKWGDIIQGYDGNNLQFRGCNTCGKIQKRSLGYCAGVNTAQANKTLAATGHTSAIAPKINELSREA